MKELLDFLDEHFTPLLLTFLVIGAWISVMHLVHSKGIAPEDKGWAREQVGVFIGALIMVLTGQVAKLMAKKSTGVPPPETSNEKNKPDEPSV